MKYIKVGQNQYVSPNVQILQRDGWQKASPELLEPNLWERFIHFLGYHFSFGQPYCVVCGKEEIVTPLSL